MATYTIQQFREKFATDEACLDKIFTLRYGKLEACPECQCVASFRRITTRRCYQCTECYTQFYPTAGTVFEKTRTPLASWFYVIYLFTSTRNGVAAKEIQRQLGVTYKCAFRMGHCIRALIQGMGAEALKGLVECDETFVGGKESNKHKDRRPKPIHVSVNKEKRKSPIAGKTIVFGALERDGKVITRVIPDVTTKSLKAALKETVEEGSIVITDEHGGYKSITDKYFHGYVSHSKGEYARGVVHTNSIEGFWAQLKRTVGGTHISVSPKYLQQYANECAFRYNNRKEPQMMFKVILENLPVREM
ncbi:MAG: IS1595 family transposase [Bacteroidetes bacterium]|nr:IS1595 family transposase [Bacteroidota bacterium]